MGEGNGVFGVQIAACACVPLRGVGEAKVGCLSTPHILPLPAPAFQPQRANILTRPVLDAFPGYGSNNGKCPQPASSYQPQTASESAQQ